MVSIKAVRPLVGGLLVALAAAACGATVQHASYSDPINEATSAAVNIGLTVENGTLRALSPADDNLFTADIDYIGDITHSATGGAQRSITLRENTNLQNTSGDTMAWTLGLSPLVPLDLSLGVSSGYLDADLTDLQLHSLGLAVSSGRSDLTTPLSDTLIDTTASVSSGILNLNVPAGSSVSVTSATVSSGQMTINVTGGATFALETVAISSGEFDLNVGDNLSVASSIDISSGTAIVTVPDGTGVQVNVQRNSSGTVNLPENYLKTTEGGSDGEGIWESDNFQGNPLQVVITLTISSGTFNVK